MFVTLVLLGSPAFGEYTPPRFFELVGGADLIVAGEIETLGEETYMLRVDRVLAGNCDSPAVEVRRFRDWGCAQRWKPYARGQRLVAFLRGDAPISNELARPIYRAIGAGIESELPVEEQSVYCRLDTVLPASSEGVGPYAGLYNAQLADLYSAVEGYRDHYRLTFGDRHQSSQDRTIAPMFVTRLERLEPQQANPGSPFRSRQTRSTPLSRLQDFAHRSPLHWSLIESTEEFATQLGAGDVGWRTQRQRASAQAAANDSSDPSQPRR